MLSRSIADRLCMAWLGLYMRWSPIEANGSIICLYGGEGGRREAFAGVSHWPPVKRSWNYNESLFE